MVLIRNFKSIKLICFLLKIFLVMGCVKDKQTSTEIVAEKEGLVAFWDFRNSEDNIWQSQYDPKIIDRSFPLYLRQIGDNKRYGIDNWPYQEKSSQIEIDETGPFGRAIRFNQGYIYGEVPRVEFDNSLLDLKGNKPFTMIAWVKFNGNRHMVSGIWDEGGWNRYAGRRQAALFAGLFNQKGVIAHVSSTGAASFPQSNVDGSQYARLRAIDGQPFEDEQWVSIAMTYDPENKIVKAYLNGKLNKYTIADPVTEDVMQNSEVPPANPFKFEEPIYSPTSFQVKYNGYDYKEGKIKEHRLWVDLDAKNIRYNQVGGINDQRFRVHFDVLRQEKSILTNAISAEVLNEDVVDFQFQNGMVLGDKIFTSLEYFDGQEWQQIGSNIEKEILEGAPFTFGRALGLAEDGLEHGSKELFIDGVAVFNRVLSNIELKEISFSQ